jgi:hypothetical protein
MTTVLDAFGVQVPLLAVNVVTVGAIGKFPLTVGSVRTGEPAIAGAWSVTEPDVSPATTIALIL